MQQAPNVTLADDLQHLCKYHRNVGTNAHCSCAFCNTKSAGIFQGNDHTRDYGGAFLLWQHMEKGRHNKDKTYCVAAGDPELSYGSTLFSHIRTYILSPHSHFASVLFLLSPLQCGKHLKSCLKFRITANNNYHIESINLRRAVFLTILWLVRIINKLINCLIRTYHKPFPQLDWFLGETISVLYCYLPLPGLFGFLPTLEKFIRIVANKFFTIYGSSVSKLFT